MEPWELFRMLSVYPLPIFCCLAQCRPHRTGLLSVSIESNPCAYTLTYVYLRYLCTYRMQIYSHIHSLTYIYRHVHIHRKTQMHIYTYNVCAHANTNCMPNAHTFTHFAHTWSHMLNRYICSQIYINTPL